MGVAKINSTGKQLQIVTDDGTVYCTSVSYMRSLLYGHLKGNMILLGKFPNKVNPDRYKKSEVYDPSGTYKKEEDDNKDTLTNSNDAYSIKSRQDNKEAEMYNTNVVDF